MKKRLVSMLINIIFVFETLFSIPLVTFAVDNTWNLYVKDFGHNYISFEVSNVDFAQNAKICIELNAETDKDDHGVLYNGEASSFIEIPFYISNTYQSFTFEYPENKYLESGHYYRIYLIDGNGNITYDSQNEEYKIIIPNHAYQICYNASRSIIGRKGALIYDYSNIAKYAYTTLNFTKYKGELISDNCIKINYPEQEIGSKIEFTLSDGFGCETEITGVVESELSSSDITIDVDMVGKTSTIAKANWPISTAIRMCVQIGDNIYCSNYESSFTQLEVNYPETEIGTEINVWFEGELGTVTDPQTFKVYDRKGQVFVDSITKDKIETLFTVDEYLNDEVASAYVITNGKRYEGEKDGYGRYIFNYSGVPGNKVTIYILDKQGYSFSVTKTIPNGDGQLEFVKCNVDTSIVSFSSETSELKSITLLANGKNYTLKQYNYDFDFDENDYCYKVNYAIKVGTKVTAKVTTKDGYIYTKTATAKAVKPKISIKKFYSGDTKISGSTKAGASVNIKIGKKTYKTLANKNGDFSKRVKAFKSGTKITVNVTTKTNCTNKKSTKVKALWGNIYLNDYVYRNSSTVKIKVTSVRKNDRVKLTVGNKIYTQKVKKTNGASTMIFKIKKATAGTKVTIKYTDSFGKRKSYSVSDIVYIGDDIYKGMSERDCLLTTWGYPVMRNNYNGFIQWKFVRGSSDLYVYIRNGKVSDIQHINY